MPNKKNIQNFYESIPKDEEEIKHDIFSLPFRMLIIGSSGSGKTNAVMNIIKNMNGIFADVCVVTKNSQEPLYQFLKEKLKDLCTLCDGLESAPQLDTFDKKERHLVIFDDLVNEINQKTVCDYFIRCRKLNISAIYISQSFFHTPKMIRQNIGYLVIVKLSSMGDLARIIRESSITQSKEDIMQMYTEATKIPMSWLMIDLISSKYYGGFELIFEG